MTSLFLLEQGNHKEQHACADDGYNEFPEKSGFLDVSQAHKPAAKETTYHTDDNIDNQAEATALHQFASQPASHCTDEQKKNNSYNVHSFRFWLNIYDGAKVQKNFNLDLDLNLDYDGWLLFCIFHNQYCVRHSAFSFVVEAAVVGRTVENSLELIEIQPYRGGAAAIEVEGITATEPS